MQYVRFIDNKKSHYGLLEGDVITEISNNFLGDYTKTSEHYKLEDVTLLCPTQPSKVVCVGLNYMEHIKELGHEKPSEPVIFLKPPTACIAHGETIVLPPGCKRVDFEGELAVVIGQTCKNVTPEAAGQYILGYSCINDVSARDFQQKDGQWARAKGFDTFCPYGPWITPLDTPTGQDIALAVRTYLNNTLMQDGNTKDMLFDPFYLVSFISRVMTLLPGDVIATGTPMGVAPLAAGDVVEIDIEQVGRLRNVVQSTQ